MRFKIWFIVLVLAGLLTLKAMGDVEPKRAVNPSILPTSVIMLNNDATFGGTATNLFDFGELGDVKDSTAYYRVTKYMSIQVIVVSAVTDSFRGAINIYAANDTSGQGAEPVYFDALMDSIRIISNNQVDNKPVFLELPPSKFFWCEIAPNDTTGKDQKLKLILTRDD